MADRFALAEFTTPVSAGGTFSITNSAVITNTCQAAVILYSAELTDDTDFAHAIQGLTFVADDGVATSEFSAGMSVRSIDNLPTTHTTTTVKYNGPTTKGIIAAPVDTTSSAYQIACSYNAFIAGGITLNSVTATSQTKGVAMLIDSVSRAYVGVFASSPSGASEAVGGTGNEFEPDILIISTTNGTFSGTGSFNLAGINTLSFAINDGSDSQIGAAVGWNSLVEPADADGIVWSDRTPSMQNTNSPPFETVTITFTSTGFDHISDTGSPDGCYLAIKFASADTRAACFNFLAAASTGNQSFNCGIRPTVVLTQSTLISTLDTETDQIGSSGRSMFNDTIERGYSVSSKPGFTVNMANPTDAHSYQGDYSLLTLDNDGVVTQAATLSSIDNSGFTLNFSTADAAGYFSCLVIGEEVPPTVLDETEEISEAFLGIPGHFLTLNETEEVSEDATFIEGHFLVLDEEEQILDDAFVSVETVVLTGREPAGWTFAGGTERGTSLTCGAVQGTVL